MSDRNETLTLHVPYVNAGSASFGGFESEGYTIKAPVRVGDEVLAGAKPDLIKIDVEGFELRVVNGLKDMIAAAQPIIATEFFAENLERCGNIYRRATSAFQRSRLSGLWAIGDA